jgi:hypothetical protein
MNSEGTNYNQQRQSVDPSSNLDHMSQTYPSGGTGNHSYSHPSFHQTVQGSQSNHPNMPYSHSSGGGTNSSQKGSFCAVPTTPYGNSLPPLTSPYMMGNFHTVGMESSADTPSAYFMSPSYPIQAPRSILKPKMEALSTDRRYSNETSERDDHASAAPRDPSVGQNQNMNNAAQANVGTKDVQFSSAHSQTNTNSVGGGKEELPRRILQFEPSPSQRGNPPPAQSIDTKSLGHKDSSPKKMSPLDGSHRAQMEGYGHHQYEAQNGFQSQYDFYNPAGSSGNRTQSHGQYPMQTSQRLPGSSAKKTTFSPHISNAFDGMPFVDFHPNSDTKLDDLMISPAVGMSNRGGRAGGIMRYV